MPPSPPPRIEAHGLLIIRAWVEEGSDERLRAEVKMTNDVSAGIQRTVTVARAEEVRATVEAWLADVLRAPVSAGPARPAGS